MTNEAMLMVSSVMMVLYATLRLYTALIDARASQRMAESIEDDVQLAELEMLDAQECVPEQEQPEQDTPPASRDDESRALLVRKGADRIRKLRAEAGFSE